MDPQPSKHAKYMDILRKLAIDSEPVARAKLAAMIVYKNTIISFGFNQRKSHPFQAKFGKNGDAIFLHAETDCIKNALRILDIDDLRKASLYVCRVKWDSAERNDIVYGLAKPCSGCARAIANFGIRNVYYSLDDEGYAKL